MRSVPSYTLSRWVSSTSSPTNTHLLSWCCAVLWRVSSCLSDSEWTTGGASGCWLVPFSFPLIGKTQNDALLWSLVAVRYLTSPHLTIRGNCLPWYYYRPEVRFTKRVGTIVPFECCSIENVTPFGVTRSPGGSVEEIRPGGLPIVPGSGLGPQGRNIDDSK